MNRPVLRLVEDAENEFYDIIEYYKEFDSDLPYDFLNEFEQATQRLLKFPNSGHPYLHETKRTLSRTFSIGIVYKLFRRNSCGFRRNASQKRTRLLERTSIIKPKLS